MPATIIASSIGTLHRNITLIAFTSERLLLFPIEAIFLVRVVNRNPPVLIDRLIRVTDPYTFN
jgi:hypothetical protein